MDWAFLLSPVIPGSRFYVGLKGIKPKQILQACCLEQNATYLNQYIPLEHQRDWFQQQKPASLSQ
jgi:hypothetical protein